jgi:hypothetical protein
LFQRKILPPSSGQKWVKLECHVIKLYKDGQWEQGNSRAQKRQLPRKTLTRATFKEGPLKAMSLAKLNGSECLVLRERERASHLSFLQGANERLSWPAQEETQTSMFMGWSLISVISQKIQSRCVVSLTRILVSSCILPWLTYPDDIDGYAGGAVWPWSKWMSFLFNLYHPTLKEDADAWCILGQVTLDGPNKTTDILLQKAQYLMLCLDRTLLIWLKVIPRYRKKKSYWSWTPSTWCNPFRWTESPENLLCGDCLGHRWLWSCVPRQKAQSAHLLDDGVTRHSDRGWSG